MERPGPSSGFPARVLQSRSRTRARDPTRQRPLRPAWACPTASWEGPAGPEALAGAQLAPLGAGWGAPAAHVGPLWPESPHPPWLPEDRGHSPDRAPVRQTRLRGQDASASGRKIRV